MEALLLFILSVLAVIFGIAIKMELQRREDMEVKERKYEKSFKKFTETEKRIKNDKS